MEGQRRFESNNRGDEGNANGREKQKLDEARNSFLIKEMYAFA